MIRVLVVVQQTADFENRALVAALSTVAADRADIVQFRLPAAGATPHAIASIAELNQANAFDVIHAIGPSSLLAVLPVGCQPIIYTPITHNLLRGIRRLRWISQLRTVIVAAPSIAARRAMIAAGVNARNIRALATPFIPQAGTSVIARDQVGLTEDDRVILAVGESTRPAGHKLAAWATVILFCLDNRHKLLLCGGPYIDVIRRFTNALRQPGFCCIAEDALGHPVSFDKLAPLADVALFTPAAAGGLLAAQICRAGQLPVIASPSPLVTELAAERLIVAGDTRAKSVAQALHHYFDDDPNRTRVLGQPITNPVNSLSPYLALYEDALVGRQADHFESVATARQS